MATVDRDEPLSLFCGKKTRNNITAEKLATIVGEWPPGLSEGHGLCRRRPAMNWYSEAVAVVTGPPLVDTTSHLQNSNILVKAISSSVM